LELSPKKERRLTEKLKLNFSKWNTVIDIQHHGSGCADNL